MSEGDNPSGEVELKGVDELASTRHHDETERDHSFVPHVTHDDFPEFTIKGFFLCGFLALLLGSANVYLGLLVGMTVSASIPASVMSMACLKMFKKSNILENNIVQTGASAGEALAAGVIFTLPGLVIIENLKFTDEAFKGAEGWDTFLGVNYAYTTMIALFGGMLGIMFSIPVRRALIVEIDPPLCFPEGVATFGVLVAGESGGWAAWSVLTGGGVGFLTKICEEMGFWNAKIGFGWLYDNKFPSYLAINVTGSLWSVGYIVGWNTTTVLFVGALMQWLVFIPVSAVINDHYHEENWDSDRGAYDGENLANIEFGTTKYIGVGLMIIGGCWALISVAKELGRAVKTGSVEFYRAIKNAGGPAEQIKRTDKDIPTVYSITIIILCFIGMYVTYGIFNGKWGWNFLLLIVAFILAFLFSAVAAYMAGLVGSSNNPISGVTICCTLVISGLVVAMFGSDDPKIPMTVVALACGVASACAISGDNMQDLKAGRLLGATPWKQEAIMSVGVVVTALVVAPILQLLDEAYTLGVGLTAPQAYLMASIPVGIQNNSLPWIEIGIGIGVGVVVISTDLIMSKCLHLKFRLPVLAFAVATYLPIHYLLPMFVGGMIRLGTDLGKGIALFPDEEEHASEGILYAAGVVAGDSITGILAAIPITITGNGDVLKVVKDPVVWPSVFPFIWLTALQTYFAFWEPFKNRELKKRAEKGEIEDQDQGHIILPDDPVEHEGGEQLPEMN